MSGSSILAVGARAGVADNLAAYAGSTREAQFRSFREHLRRLCATVVARTPGTSDAGAASPGQAWSDLDTSGASSPRARGSHAE